ncbi:MAG: pilus assembly protein PilM [Myxococcales bacterium]|nr:pilus assembly protein PilM [Myxococcales bacterium]
MLGRSILGLDIGSWSVKACELRQEIRGCSLVRFESQQLPESSSDEERYQAVAEFLEERRLPLDFVVAALPCSHVTERRLRFPFADQRRVLQAVPFELEDDLLLPLSQLARTEQCILLPSGETEVLSILAPRDEVRRALECLRSAHAEPRLLDIEGAALANLVGFLRREEEAGWWIDLGHSSTVLVRLRGAQPTAVRSIPIAGRHFTAAIAGERGISNTEAEVIKHESGIFDSSSGSNPSAAADVFNALAREIRRTVSGIQGESNSAAAVLTGGSSHLPEIEAALSEQTGLDCRTLSVPPGPGGRSLLASVGAADFATAAALALRGPRPTRSTTLNLRSDEFSYRPDLSQLRGKIRIAAGLAVLVLVLWVGGLVAHASVRAGQVGRLTEQLHALRAQTFAGTSPVEDPLGAMETQAGEMIDLADHLGVTDSGLSSLGVLLEISARVPEKLDLWLSELRIERRSVQARGSARNFETVGRLREELLASAEFSEVRVSDVITNPRTGGKNFSLTFSLGNPR